MNCIEFRGHSTGKRLEHRLGRLSERREHFHHPPNVDGLQRVVRQEFDARQGNEGNVEFGAAKAHFQQRNVRRRDFAQFFHFGVLNGLGSKS